MNIARFLPRDGEHACQHGPEVRDSEKLSRHAHRRPQPRRVLLLPRIQSEPGQRQQRWPARGPTAHILPDGKPHDWTLDYSPAAADGQGRINVTLDEHAVRLNLRPGEKAIGAQSNRFGIVMTHIDGNGPNVYLDDLTCTVNASGEK